MAHGSEIVEAKPLPTDSGGDAYDGVISEFVDEWDVPFADRASTTTTLAWPTGYDRIRIVGRLSSDRASPSQLEAVNLRFNTDTAAQDNLYTFQKSGGDDGGPLVSDGAGTQIIDVPAESSEGGEEAFTVIEMVLEAPDTVDVFKQAVVNFQMMQTVGDQRTVDVALFKNTAAASAALTQITLTSVNASLLFGKLTVIGERRADASAIITAGGSPLSVSDGTTTVNDVESIVFSKAASVSSGGAGIANVNNDDTGGGGGVPEAPNDGEQYGRQSESWTVVHDPVTVTDSPEIDFTLTDQDITASLVPGSIDETKLDASVNASLDLADSAAQPGDLHDPVTVTDTPEIDMTLVGQDISATIVTGSIDETKLDASVNASLDLADSALQDAPSDGDLYGREDGQWVQIGELWLRFNAAAKCIVAHVDGQSNVTTGADAIDVTVANYTNNPNIYEYRGTDAIGTARQWVQYDVTETPRRAGSVRIVGSLRGDVADWVWVALDKVQRNVGWPVFVISQCVPGASIANWEVPGGSAYVYFRDMAKEAIGHLRAGTNGAPAAFPNAPDYPNIRIWNQGEADADDSFNEVAPYDTIERGRPSWDYYKDQYRALEDQLTDDELIDYRYTVTFMVGPAVESVGFATEFNYWRGNEYCAADQINALSLISTEGVGVWDNAHFSLSGANRLGEVVANAALGAASSQVAGRYLGEVFEDENPTLSNDLNVNQYILDNVEKIRVVGPGDTAAASIGQDFEAGYYHTGDFRFDYFDPSFNGVVGPPVVKSDANYYQDGASGAVGIGRLFDNLATVQNVVSSGVFRIGTFVTLNSAPVIQADTLAMGEGQAFPAINMSVQPLYRGVNGGTWNIVNEIGYYHTQKTDTGHVLGQTIGFANTKPVVGGGTVEASVSFESEVQSTVSNSAHFRYGGNWNPLFPLPPAPPVGNNGIIQLDDTPNFFNGAEFQRPPDAVARPYVVDDVDRSIRLTGGGGDVTLPSPSANPGRLISVSNQSGSLVTLISDGGGTVPYNNTIDDDDGRTYQSDGVSRWLAI